MFFRQLFDSASSTYTYLLADERTREAVLVDPVFEQHSRDAALIRELGLSLRYTLDTHCHADHVTGAWLMKTALGSQIVSFVTEDRLMVITGDALLVRGAGRTDFQQGSASRLFRSIREQLFALPDDCVVYPGHDYAGRTSSTIGEERVFNPRIGGKAREEDFVGYMRNLGLPGMVAWRELGLPD
jgi:glyoxylase-like metal-dependent hydrolase (beta-lactamase superfamily II)